nr:immunoglobulin light chain junction region [Macaca mulatta]MOV95597.1 immunoglobulin light chain junction region [Macaca mulatta]MOV96008.1 immunoglobulin light chain junction region [Macaca mulatta]MOV96038.1 immunoglobulin light chain junction region [Macaca mulatta]MOV96691.1 immunoglobulin light chain junction region [Macaca mulatta]
YYYCCSYTTRSTYIF